jgi:MFS family permease
VTNDREAAEPHSGGPHGVALRRAIRFSYIAAVVWACGNAIASSILFSYLIQELGAKGRQLAYLQVIPALFGLLRLLTPLVIERLHGTKRTYLALSAAAYALLFAIPSAIEFGRETASRPAAISLLIGIYCVHQLLEQVAVIALWTWLTDLVPRRLRGRIFARRNIWKLVIVIPTLLASGFYIDRAIAAEREAATAARDASLATDVAAKPVPIPARPYAAAHYSALINISAVLMLVSLAPLIAVPQGATTQIATPSKQRPGLRTLVASLREPGALRLVVYGCWFSFFNGLFTAAQFVFPKAVLNLGLGTINAMQTTMRVGQIGFSAWAGRASDRCGNRPVIVVSQLLVGAAPLFYFLAAPNSPYWLYGAWILWSAYAGINICVPNLTFRLVPPSQRSALYATYQALSGLLFAVGALAGGFAFDYVITKELIDAGDSLPRFGLFFLAAFVLRSTGAAIVATVPEPGAKRVSELFARKRE